jgi:hypothetical protein
MEGRIRGRGIFAGEGSKRCASPQRGIRRSRCERERGHVPRGTAKRGGGNGTREARDPGDCSTWNTGVHVGVSRGGIASVAPTESGLTGVSGGIVPRGTSWEMEIECRGGAGPPGGDCSTWNISDSSPPCRCQCSRWDGRRRCFRRSGDGRRGAPRPRPLPRSEHVTPLLPSPVHGIASHWRGGKNDARRSPKLYNAGRADGLLTIPRRDPASPVPWQRGIEPCPG